MFTSEELKQLSAKGITIDVVERQLEYFRKGFPFLRLDRAAVVGDGILQMSDDEISNLESAYGKNIGQRKVFKFVPASGAATRMFKNLYDFMHEHNKTANPKVKEIFERLHDFAFYPDLKQIMDKQQIADSDHKKIAAAILMRDSLNYGNLPKGLLLFHKYANDVRTAMEEHLVEGANYAVNADGAVNLHFTISPEHQQEFETLIERKLKQYSDTFKVCYNISFSQQKSSTDTIAVDLDNIPVRNDDGSLLFRPGGHGALLENLNEIDADIIFIKNIDNVEQDRLKPVTVKYKKALAGLLLELQEQTNALYRHLRDDKCDEELLQRTLNFLTNRLSFQPPAALSTWSPDDIKTYLLNILRRPVRVCGMVKNEGEPGGGPFWVRNDDGSTSLQIAEASQINMDDPQQANMIAAATHFNPVDLVCAVKDCDGNHYNLLDYRDLNTGFISMKSKDGMELKAQELPGLWNGAMAHWNTVFVEVPIETFKPVKTINDLLRPQHQ
jgi:hypothetical protein